MNLMHYLTVGRSFGGAKEGPNNYRVAHAGMLPTFGSATPTYRKSVSGRQRAMETADGCPAATELLLDFQSREDGCRVPTPVSAPAIPTPSPRLDSRRTIIGSGEPSRPALSGPPRRPSATPEAKTPFAGPSAPAVVTEPEMVPRPKKKPHWFLSAIGFFHRRQRASLRPAAVQGEWALGRITVVRNDLSDSDLEVVPTNPVPPSSPREKSVPAGESGWSPARSAVGWITWLRPAARVRT